MNELNISEYTQLQVCNALGITPSFFNKVIGKIGLQRGGRGTTRYYNKSEVEIVESIKILRLCDFSWEQCKVIKEKEIEGKKQIISSLKKDGFNYSKNSQKENLAKEVVLTKGKEGVNSITITEGFMLLEPIKIICYISSVLGPTQGFKMIEAERIKIQKNIKDRIWKEKEKVGIEDMRLSIEKKVVERQEELRKFGEKWRTTFTPAKKRVDRK